MLTFITSIIFKANKPEWINQKVIFIQGLRFLKIKCGYFEEKKNISPAISTLCFIDICICTIGNRKKVIRINLFRDSKTKLEKKIKFPLQN